MNLNRKSIPAAIVAVAFVVTLAAIATFLLNNPSDKIVFRWDQPASVNYGMATPFSIMVIERNRDWSDFPYTERTYHLYLGNDFPYGHRYRFPFYYHGRQVENDIKNSAVEWSDDGVVFKAISGESLFIPARIFARKQS